VEVRDIPGEQTRTVSQTRGCNTEVSAASFSPPRSYQSKVLLCIRIVRQDSKRPGEIQEFDEAVHRTSDKVFPAALLRFARLQQPAICDFSDHEDRQGRLRDADAAQHRLFP
jgi:hypothetical protein